MPDSYTHLGEFADLCAASRRSHPVHPKAVPGQRTQKLFRKSLSFAPGAEKPRSVRLERQWVKDGVEGQLISWSVGYGPRTEVFVFKPEGAQGSLPGVLALHDHGGFKFFGKEKIADGPNAVHNTLKSFRRQYYGSRAYTNALAREGFVVLVPDVFLWGSRRFSVQTLSKVFGLKSGSFGSRDGSRYVTRYNRVAGNHEHIVEKNLRILGSTMAGVVSFEDRISAQYLASRKDVVGGRIGCVGLSGGGMRTVLLQGSCKLLGAAVVVGAMCTYESLLDHNAPSHTWMFYPSDWSLHGDWPDIAACRAPSPLMVLYDKGDELFTLKGQQQAHRKIASHYRSVGKPRNYVGRFYPGLHKFDLPMQADAFSWLKKQLY